MAESEDIIKFVRNIIKEERFIKLEMSCDGTAHKYPQEIEQINIRIATMERLLSEIINFVDSTSETRRPEPDNKGSCFSITEDSPDDLTLCKEGKPILKISLPEQSTQWNTKLP